MLPAVNVNDLINRIFKHYSIISRVLTSYSFRVSLSLSLFAFTYFLHYIVALLPYIIAFIYFSVFNHILSPNSCVFLQVQPFDIT